MSKRFGIDARWISREISGIGRYTERLIHALSQLDSENLYFLFFSDKESQKKFSQKFPYHLKSNFNPVYVPYPPFSLRGMWAIRKEIKRFKIDLFHSPNFMLPLFGPKIKYAATIHDLIPLIHPEFTPRSKKTRFYFIYSALIKYLAKKCDLILTDSEHSRIDVVQHLNVPENKVKRVYISIDERYKPKNSEPFPNKLQEAFKIQPPYFLYVGRHDLYKNILGMVQGYALYLKKEKNPIPLVITGKRDARYPQAYLFCEKQNILDRVCFTDYVSDASLLSLYQHAYGVVLVSKYEGFGLPVLEAMACGVPVICSKSASLPEVAGEAALNVSADSTEEIAESFSRFTSSNGLREELIQKGYSQVKKFSWNECAKETLQHYLSLT